MFSSTSRDMAGELKSLLQVGYLEAINIEMVANVVANAVKVDKEIDDIEDECDPQEHEFFRNSQELEKQEETWS